jgi:hypothetical protein
MITEVMRPMELERNDGDEFYPNGIFEFHITRMIKYINQHQGEFEKVKIDVENYYRYFMNPDINQMYVEQADLERPVIFAEITPDRLYNGYPGIGEDYYLRGYNLINGHHRIHKAYQLGIKMIWAWILPMEQHYQFMSKGFEKYREYWNGKLSQVYI